MEEEGPTSGGEVIDFVSHLTGAARFRIEESLPHGFVRLKVAEAERRQAQHDIRSVEDIVVELLRNSRDAGAEQILLAFQREGGRRLITVLDDGCGIPPDMHRIVFEPRVTSKNEDFGTDRYGVHGRGMALFSIKSRLDDAQILESDIGRGTVMSMSVDLSRVPERSDQATFPTVEETESGLAAGSGPHNVPRVIFEMSLDHPAVDFYIGSFSDVLSTVRSIDGEGAPWSGVSRIDSVRELGVRASELGLKVSERNCYRVLSGEVAPLEPVKVARGTVSRPGTVKRIVGKPSAPRRNPLKVVRPHDLERIAGDARNAAREVLDKYYLRPLEARARRGRGRITITLFVSGKDEDEDQR